jgi:protein O-mannosyl-transferase
VSARERRKPQPRAGSAPPAAGAPHPTPARLGTPAILGMCAALALVTFAAFWGLMSCGFVNFDDNVYVTEEPHVQAGLSWQGLEWAFTTNYFGFYYPLTWLSHMLDVQLFGMNAGMHHLTSLFLHVLGALLLFLSLLRMTRAYWRSALVALLFAIHPLHVESVAWISERKDVLSTLFWFLAILAYAFYAERPSSARYLPVFASFLLGLLAKPMLITLPFTLLLLDYWPLGRWPSSQGVRIVPPANDPAGRPATAGRLLAEKLPLFALIPLFAYITLVSQEKANALVSSAGIPVTQRLANALISYAAYVWKLFAPAHLAVYYPHPKGAVSYGLAALCLVGLLAATGALLWLGRTRRYLAVGWLWYLGTLVPVIGLIQVGDQARADRYTYVPFVGLFILVVWGGAEMAGRSAPVRWLLRGATAAGLAALFFFTRAQVACWTDSIALFERALAVAPQNALAHQGLGTTLYAMGHKQEAISHFREALRIEPGYPDIHANLGIALSAQGLYGEAIEQLREALRLQPEDAKTRTALADALENQGVALDRDGRTGDATEFFKEALAIRPDSADALDNLGLALAKSGRLPEAAEFFSRAVKVRPDFASAHNNLGLALAKMGRLPEAAECFQRAVDLQPDFAQAQNNLRTARAQMQKAPGPGAKEIPR